jgi:hypothetical protein
MHVQAKSELHAIQSLHEDGDNIMDIEEIEAVSYEDAKTIQVLNTEYDPENPQEDVPEFFNLFDLQAGNDFVILSTTEY